MYEDDEPVDIGAIRFGMALRIASVFTVVAAVTLIGGVLATVAGGIDLAQQTDFLGRHVYSGTAVVGYVLGGLVMSVIVASFFAFLGYVLEILVEIYAQTWRTRMALEDDDDEEEEDEATDRPTVT